MRKLKVGIIGATGMVGQRFVQLLEKHPWFDIEVLAASERSAGKSYEEAVRHNWSMDSDVPSNLSSKLVIDSVKDCKKICNSVDFIFCALNMDKKSTQDLENTYAKNECPVISNNSAHRWTKDVPVIIPEINSEHIKVIDIQRKRLGTKKGFIAAKPNCSLQCFLPAIYPLLKFGVKSVVLSTYQAISGAGKTFKQFPEINDNIIPYIDGEEQKTEREPLKILGTIGEQGIINSKSPKISANCIRVPVSNGHLASVFVDFESDVSKENIIDVWENFNPLNLPSSPEKFLNYFYENNRPQVKLDRTNGHGMTISIGRLSNISEKSIKFVCMSHNTVRGAAGGAVLLAELLYKNKYLF